MPESPLFAVLLKDEDQLQLGPISQALASCKKIPFQDAAFEAKKCWGIIGQEMAESEAAQLATGLQAKKVAALVVPQERLRPLPACQVLAKDRFPWDTLPWEKIRVLGAAAIKSSTSRTVDEKQGPTAGQRAASIGIMLATGIPVSIGPKSKTIQKTITDTELSFVLDLVLDEPSERLRISADRFDYTFLKEKMLPNTMGNFRLLLQDFITRAPKARRSRGLRVLLAGQPVNTMGYESLADLERECRWLFSL